MRYQKDININIANAEYNCKVLGNGAINVIAFHGFGQDGNAFLPVAIQNPGYTIYSFDLPFHGYTKIDNPSLCLSGKDVAELVQKLIVHTGIENFSLLGFSMGTRMIFPIIEHFYSKIECVWLLAPDGIKINFWYRLATSTRVARNLFRNLLNKPKLSNGIRSVIQSLHLMDKSTLLFLFKSINTSEKREQVSSTWNYFRKLRTDIDKVSKIVNKNDIQVFFIMGEKDNIIPRSIIEPLLQKTTNSKVVSLLGNHQKLIKYFSEWYVSDTNK